MRRIYCDIRKCTSCRTCELACAVRHSKSQTLYGALLEEPRPRQLVRVKSSQLGPFPLRCHHCEDAACIDACKTGATYRDEDSGKVLINRDTCVGCWMCVMVCPFGAVFPDVSSEKALKCDMCAGYDTPACAEACPTGAIYYEEFDEFKKEYQKGVPDAVPNHR